MFCHACLLSLVIPMAPGQPQPPPAVIVNHVGFTPTAAKFCYVPIKSEIEFSIIEMPKETVVFNDRMVPGRSDLGEYVVGDFSSLQTCGTFRIVAGNSRSEEFEIADRIYDDALQKVLSYFRKQRCGPATTGYNGPCHLDDGKRVDNNRRMDVTGGWHDACDLRKWVGATIYGMIGLLEVQETLRPAWDQGQIEQEIRWGNRYFLAMQEPAGFVMHNCGGDIVKHGDNNRWTDNQIGTDDDRLIQTKPAGNIEQFNFVMAQAMTARFTRANDDSYSLQCGEAAQRGLTWCGENNADDTAAAKGAAIEAALMLYLCRSESRHAEQAVQYARELMQLQIIDESDADTPIRGFFRTSARNAEPDRQISRGCWHLIGLCDLVERIPYHPDAQRWKRAIEMYCRDYLARLAERNAFGIVPFGLFSGNPGGNRKVGTYFYRYFMKPDENWWVGINANLASAGVGLMKASRILEDRTLAALAQRQLDWILGANPFNASTMMEVGHNQPDIFVTGEFRPATPRLAGAVLNGIGGTDEDMPDLKEGSWQTCEYWTPMVGYTMWLMAELQQGI